MSRRMSYSSTPPRPKRSIGRVVDAPEGSYAHRVNRGGGKWSKIARSYVRGGKKSTWADRFDDPRSVAYVKRARTRYMPYDQPLPFEFDEDVQFHTGRKFPLVPPGGALAEGGFVYPSTPSRRASVAAVAGANVNPPPPSVTPGSSTVRDFVKSLPANRRIRESDIRAARKTKSGKEKMNAYVKWVNKLQIPMSTYMNVNDLVAYFENGGDPFALLELERSRTFRDGVSQIPFNEAQQRKYYEARAVMSQGADKALTRDDIDAFSKLGDSGDLRTVLRALYGEPDDAYSDYFSRRYDFKLRNYHYDPAREESREKKRRRYKWLSARDRWGNKTLMQHVRGRRGE